MEPKSGIYSLAGILVTASAAPVLAQPAPPPTPVPEVEAPKPKWETTAGLGFALTDGNSDTILFSANALTLRKWDRSEFSAGIDAGYGESEGDKNVEYIKGFAQYNWLMTDRWYAFGRFDGLSDAIADIDYRFTLSAGLGYYLIKNERTTLAVEVGPGYVFEKIGGEERTYATIRFGEKFTHKFSDRARMWQSLEFLPKIDDWGDYFMTFELGVEADITRQLAMRVVLQDWYVSEPAPGREENDLKVTAGVNYKFL